MFRPVRTKDVLRQSETSANPLTAPTSYDMNVYFPDSHLLMQVNAFHFGACINACAKARCFVARGNSLPKISRPLPLNTLDLLSPKQFPNPNPIALSTVGASRGNKFLPL